MIRNRKKSSELNVILSPNELPDNKTDSRLFTRDTLCLNLMKVAKRRKMAETIAYRYKSNAMLSQEFSYEEVHGELLTTITQVINAWETYWANKSKKKSNYDITLSSKTSLSYFGEITGYFVNAYKNNISKKYGKFKTEKRAAVKQFVYLDAPISGDESSKNSYDSLVSKNSSADLIEYNQSIGYLIKTLRAYDKKENLKQQELFNGKEVPLKRQSHLARLFVALLNPRYQGNIDQIRENFGWTDYIFKRNKEVLFKKLKSEHSELGNILLHFVVNDQHDELVGEAKQEEQKKMIPKKLEVHSVFSMKNDNGKTRYSLTISVDQMIEGRWQPVKVVKKHELIVPLKSKKPVSYDEAKNN